MYFCHILAFFYDYKKDELVIRNQINALILPIKTRKK